MPFHTSINLSTIKGLISKCPSQPYIHTHTHAWSRCKRSQSNPMCAYDKVPQNAQNRKTSNTLMCPCHTPRPPAHSQRDPMILSSAYPWKLDLRGSREEGVKCLSKRDGNFCTGGLLLCGPNVVMMPCITVHCFGHAWWWHTAADENFLWSRSKKILRVLWV